MTSTTDDTGTWVDIPARKRRRSPRAIRFANIKVGDQLLRPPRDDWYRKLPWYYVVTDLWFDPVAGQDDETAGRMVALKRIGADGEPESYKQAHTVRGLASQGYHFADIDFAGQRKAAVAGWKEGKVIGIGQGAIIRRRPKLPTSRL